MKRYLIYFLLPALLLTGCVTDEQIVETVNGGTGEQMQATLTLRVAGGESAASRALTAGNENEIRTIDVLVFNKTNGDAGDGTFQYRAQTTLVGGTAGDASRTFQVTLRKSTDSDDLQKAVVLANCRALIDGLDFTGKSYADAMDMLVMARATKWNSTTDTYDPLPMWGESTFKAFTDPAAAGGPVDMYRAVAAIDVNVAAAVSGFTLSEILLYNSSTRGRLVPSGTWSGEATAPSNPGGAGWATATPFSYNVTANTSVREIYTFEAPAATGAGSDTAPFLIVKGTYNGDEGWYRIDFHGKLKASDPADAYLPLLRNFRYTVSITDVQGRGYGSAAEAAEATFTPLTTNTIAYNEGGMGSVKWDGRNYLSVTTDSYEIGNNNANQSIGHIYAATNYEGGWAAKVTIASGDEANWLTLGNTSGAGDGTKHLLGMTVKPNTQSGNRTAVVTVIAGRLRQEIRITQLLANKLSLDVGDVEAIFPAVTAPTAFMLPVEWEPAGTPVTIEIINPGTAAAAPYAQELAGATAGLAFSGANIIPATLSDADANPANGGMAQLSIKPDAAVLNPFVERRSILKITSTNGIDDVVKSVLLRQFDYHIEATGTLASYQLNTTYTLTVKSNGQWNVGSTGDVAIVSQTTDNDPNITGTTFTLKTGTATGTTPTLTFTQPEHGVTYNVNIPLKEMLPNSYIVTPGESVTFPVAKAWDAWESDKDLTATATTVLTGALTTNLLWQDVPGLITSQPTIAGTDRNATITVQTAAGLSGNAVVELKVGGITRWSWHIWVCDFNPEENTGYNAYDDMTLMGRNLGAVNNTPGDAGSFGLLYQHGRKDPFPGAAVTNANTAKVLYDFAGNSLTEGGATATGVKKVAFNSTGIVSGENNMILSIENPLTYYYGIHWHPYSMSQSRRDLWRTADLTGKSNFDPCPEGWKVPKSFPLNRAIPGPFVAGVGIDFGAVGFFPASGHRAYTNGNITSTGGSGASWYNSFGAYSGLANNLAGVNTYNAQSVMNTAYEAGAAVSVRCMKIQ